MLGINIFHCNESFRLSSISGCPLRHGQRSSEERRPRKWYNKFRGGICCYTHASEKPSCFVLFYFPAVKAFLTEAKEEFNTKWEHPSQVRFFSCTLVNYRVVSSFGFNQKYIHLFHTLFCWVRLVNYFKRYSVLYRLCCEQRCLILSPVVGSTRLQVFRIGDPKLTLPLEV